MSGYVESELIVFFILIMTIGHTPSAKPNVAAQDIGKLLKLTECKLLLDGQPTQFSFARCKNDI